MRQLAEKDYRLLIGAASLIILIFGLGKASVHALIERRLRASSSAGFWPITCTRWNGSVDEVNREK